MTSVVVMSVLKPLEMPAAAFALAKLLDLPPVGIAANSTITPLATLPVVVMLVAGVR